MISISITTFNRPEVLEWSLRHFSKYKTFYDSDIVIVDDNSSHKIHLKNEAVCKKYGFKYFYNTTREGIAKSKNIGLKYFKDKEFYILFDDDCFPKSDNYDLTFIEAFQKTGIEHFVYTKEVDYIRSILKNEMYEVFESCFGMCLFFTKNIIDNIGYFDEEFGMYGYEHAEMSQRAFLNGFCGTIKGYISPVNCGDYIYSLDQDYKYLKQLTEFGNPNFKFLSSVDRNKQEYIRFADSIWKHKNKF